jgi:hypothetical protein
MFSYGLWQIVGCWCNRRQINNTETKRHSIMQKEIVFEKGMQFNGNHHSHRILDVIPDSEPRMWLVERIPLGIKRSRRTKTETVPMGEEWITRIIHQAGAEENKSGGAKLAPETNSRSAGSNSKSRPPFVHKDFHQVRAPMVCA